MGLSPGVVQGSVELLEIAYRQQLTLPEIRASFAYLSNIPIDRIVETAQRLNWLRVGEDGVATVAPCGARLLAEGGYEAMLRRALLDFVEVVRPAWLQNAAFGRRRVLAFAGRDVAQVFVEASLADGVSDEVVAFWDSLGAMARGQKAEWLNRIGRTGERLTVDYEWRRTGRKPVWVALDDNQDGFDVLSIVSAGNSRRLSIEVKTSVVGIAGEFFLTRNEWETAGNADAHLFYLWSIERLGHPRLAVVTVSAMSVHVPHSRGMGMWKSLAIPLQAFLDDFEEPVLSEVND